MVLFNRKKRAQADARKEAEIQAIRNDTFKSVDKANKSMDKLVDFLREDEDLGITGKIWLATGGDKRK